MKKKGTAFSIPEPCHEGWDNMKPVEKGRYCSSCEKMVVDFTTMSDFQIIDYMRQNNKGSVCGRMSNVQINRTMYNPSRQSMPAFSLRALVLGTALSAFASFDAAAQGNVKVGKVAPVRVQSPVTEPIRGEVIATPVDPVPASVSGFVTDSYSGDSLANVTVTLFDVDGNVLQEAITNDKGWYLVTIEENAAYIAFVRDGYTMESRQIDEVGSRLSVSLTEQPYMLEGMIMQREE